MSPSASSIPWLKALLLGVVENGLLVLCALFLLAMPAFAAVHKALPLHPKPVASFDYSSVSSLKANPTVTGAATSSVPLLFTVTTSKGEIVYSDSSVLVASGRFAETIFPPIANGTYSVVLSAGSTTIATTTLTIGLRTEPEILLDSTKVSNDVSDGHLMRFTIHSYNASGKVRPGIRGVGVGQISFAIVPTNAEVADIYLYGYTDPNFTQPLIADSTDPLNSEPANITATSSVITITPDVPIEVPSGVTYYFDLVGTVTPLDTTYSVLSKMLTDTSARFASFTDLASTTHVIWSPNTYATSTLDAPDWTNGSLVIGIPKEGLTAVRSNAPSQDVPTCNLNASTSVAPAGMPVTLTWSSTGATSATWEGGVKDTLEGSKTFIQGSTTHTYLLNVTGPYGFANCYVTVGLPYVVPVQATTTAATTTASKDGFTATPTTGPISLLVTFKGSVNNANSCAAQTYSLGYGDGATSTITVAKNLCKAQSFTLTHSYTKVGTFTAGLYSGTGTSTKQRIQTQVIMPKAKVGGIFSGFTNVSNVLSAFDTFLQWIKKVF